MDEQQAPRRRGRQPTGEPTKISVTTIRLLQETRQALELIARKSNRSLSAEIDLRLRKSLEDDVL